MKQGRIVYGLGKMWEMNRLMICSIYDVIGVCDQNLNQSYMNFICRDELNNYQEKILITSLDFYDEIKSILIEEYKVSESRICNKNEIKDISSFFDVLTKNRDEWIKNKLLQIVPNAKILDAGAGEQRWKQGCKHLQYVSQDICEYKGTGAEGLQTNQWDTSKIDIICDIIDIPVENESFDAVLCSEVFEHICRPELAVKELSRILKPGGKLILTAPFSSLTHFAPYHYATGFNKYWYEEVLPKYCLEIEEILPNGDYYSCIRMELARLPYVIGRYDSGYPMDQVWIHTEGLIAEMEKLQRNHGHSCELWNGGYMVLARKY